MTEKTPDFYLTCSELRDIFEPRSCYIKRVISINGNEGRLLCKVSPAIYIADMIIDLDTVIFAPRFVGSILTPINEWPMYVYVCEILNENAMKDGCFTSKELKIMLWGELHKTLEAAYEYAAPSSI
jgi:hypothetical protein